LLLLSTSLCLGKGGRKEGWRLGEAQGGGCCPTRPLDSGWRVWEKRGGGRRAWGSGGVKRESAGGGGGARSAAPMAAAAAAVARSGDAREGGREGATLDGPTRLPRGCVVARPRVRLGPRF
jgi:hypothetical protein